MIRGHRDRDVLMGGSGDDLIDGGQGNDVIELSPGDYRFSITVPEMLSRLQRSSYSYQERLK